ncbi:hypothetical protein A343_2301 [Porphyromonas gingivalis JCVI SC001]|nr:hypothetical protein A343_2301 [Porphyromonas gingivalis JCVI SC001]
MGCRLAKKFLAVCSALDRVTGPAWSIGRHSNNSPKAQKKRFIIAFCFVVRSRRGRRSDNPSSSLSRTKIKKSHY